VTNLIENRLALFLSLSAGLALGGCGNTKHDEKDLGHDQGIADLTPGVLDLAGDMNTLPLDTVTPDGGEPPDGGGTSGWVWNQVPGMICDDGSETGVAVNQGDPDKLVVFFDGGGACGDYTSCYGLNTASHGPYQAPQFQHDLDSLITGSLVDRTLPNNPFADYTFVFVPYCTGDVHTGVTTQVYTQGSISKTYHHAGHLNALIVLDKLVATWPNPSKFVISGASGGGFGALFNFDTYASRYPNAVSYLLDDSGPILEQEYAPQLLADWVMSWDTISWLQNRCPGCNGTDLTPLYGAWVGQHPKSRMALLESLQDQVITAFYLLAPTEFQTALLALATDVLDAIPTFKHFYVSGNTHTMVGTPNAFSTNGVPLLTWLTQFITDDPAWDSQTPTVSQ